MHRVTLSALCLLIATGALLASACSDDTPGGGDDGQATDSGPLDTADGADGTDGAVTTDGSDGADGSDGTDGADGGDVADGTDGADTTDGDVPDEDVTDGGDADDADTSEACGGPDEVVCGQGCCGAGEVCGTNEACCAREALCGAVCCGAGEVCEGAVCKLDCGGDARCRGAAGVEVCCAEGELCTAGVCFAPTTSCADFIDCGPDEYCEAVLGQCLPQPGGAVCQAVPSGGEVAPSLLWAWDGEGAALAGYNQVMMAPMVARVDDDAVPDVVFSTFCGDASAGCTPGLYGSDGVLRVVSGLDGAPIFDVTDAAHRVNPAAQVAIGDIDDDGRVEIVTCASADDGVGDLIAFEHDGSFKWQTDDARVSCAQAAPAIADLDGDGAPEVFVRYTVVAGATGAVTWHQDCKNAGTWATDSHSPCDYTTAADLDGDGALEVVGGNAAYRADGSVYYDRSADFTDGYPSVADLDLDGTPEVVVIHSAFEPAPYQGDHWLRVLEHDGADRLGPIDINQDNTPQADLDADTVGGGGPATVANFDDDPAPEIALAGAYAYVVFEADGTVKWYSPSYDRSSRKTGSSVFDFDGDGVAEAVYSDHYWLRVYDGRDGRVRFCQCNTSATLWEYPVIADVNRDGAAEIVIASNDYAYASCPTTLSPEDGLDACVQARIDAGETAGTHGVRVFASPDRDWVGTRGVWNQHTYHVTNVAEDGSIPTREAASWQKTGLNSFRQNIQPGATNQPDLVPLDLGIDYGGCSASVVINARVENQGWAAAPAGVPVTLLVERAGAFEVAGQAATTRALLSGESEIVALPYAFAPGEESATLRYRVVVNDPSGGAPADVVECRAENNAAEISGQCIIF